MLGIRDDATRKKLLQSRTLTLILIDCRADEAATRQLKAVTTLDELQALQEQSPPSSREVTSAPR